MKQLTEKQKKNAATGAAAVAGTAAGLAGASFIPTNVEAAETADTQDEAQVTEAEPQQTATTESATASAASHEAQPEVSTHTAQTATGQSHTAGTAAGHHESEPTPDPTSASDGDSDITVLSYETVTAEDGSQVDIASVSVDGTNIVLADTTMDGYANIAGMDMNGDGQIDEDELVDVSGQGVAMQSLKDSASQMVDVSSSGSPTQPDDFMASNDEPDYINDGDVDAFMA